MSAAPRIGSTRSFSRAPADGIGGRRYHRLIIAAMTAIGDHPTLPGSREVTGGAGVRALHLRFARRLVAREHRVGEPRHLVIYRVAPDGEAEILSLVHDRMLLARAARSAQRDADG